MAPLPTEPTSEVLPQFSESKNPSDTNSREHDADSCGFSLDDSQKINAVSSSEEVLCAFCSKVHFRYLILSEEEHMMIGTSTIGTTLSNERCPSCRLVAHCISSFARAQSISPQSQVSLVSYSRFPGRQTGRRETIQQCLPKRIDIRLCTQEPGNEGQISVNDCDTIGVLLRTVKDEFSDSTILTGREALFNTSENKDFAYARPITYTVDVELLRTWIESCIDSHGFCRITKTSNNANTELRLIDVVDRCLINATLVEDYVALSYVWGPGNNKILVKSTLRHLQEKGSLISTVIPRLIADVMDFVAKIGERYVWIDTACIVQDDPLDKQRQLPIMSSIYTNAKLTIVAAVEGANDPLPRWNECYHKVSAPTELIRGLTYTVGKPPLASALARTTWNKRGWTLQEALLARRLLVFTKDLIYWSCHEESWCEDQYDEHHNVKKEPSLFAINFRLNTCKSKPSVTGRLNALLLYAKNAHTYSQRSFSNYSDIVWAFLGILTAMKEHFPNGYIWALPYDHLDAALLWLTCCERTRCVVHQYDLNSESRLPIPSWCWIGKGHKIWFLPGISETKSRVTWHEPVTCWSSGIDSADDNPELLRHSQEAVLSVSQLTTEESAMFDYAFLHFTAQTTLLSIEPEFDPSALKTFTACFRNEPVDSERHPLVAANIYLPSKRAIGHIMVPAYMFRNNTPLSGEFVLLSEYTGDIHSEHLNNDICPVGRRNSGKGPDHDRGEDDDGSPYQKEQKAGETEIEKDQNQESENEKKRPFSEGHKEGCPHHPALNVMLIDWDKTHNIKNFARRVAIARIDPSAWEEVAVTEKTIVLG